MPRARRLLKEKARERIWGRRLSGLVASVDGVDPSPIGCIHRDVGEPCGASHDLAAERDARIGVGDGPFGEGTTDAKGGLARIIEVAQKCLGAAIEDRNLQLFFGLREAATLDAKRGHGECNEWKCCHEHGGRHPSGTNRTARQRRSVSVSHRSSIVGDSPAGVNPPRSAHPLTTVRRGVSPRWTMYEAPVSLPEFDAAQGLVVRPDVLALSLSARVDESDARRALIMLRSAAELVQMRLLTIDRATTFAARGFQSMSAGASKLAKGDDAEWQLGGVAWVTLDASMDYWQRAERVAAVVTVLRDAGAELARRKPAVKLHYRGPVARVRDVGPYRAQLVEARRAQLKAAVGELGLTVRLTSADTTTDVVQHALSLEEVVLSLGGGRNAGG